MALKFIDFQGFIFLGFQSNVSNSRMSVKFGLGLIQLEEGETHTKKKNTGRKGHF